MGNGGGPVLNGRTSTTFDSDDELHRVHAFPWLQKKISIVLFCVFMLYLCFVLFYFVCVMLYIKRRGTYSRSEDYLPQDDAIAIHVRLFLFVCERKPKPNKTTKGREGGGGEEEEEGEDEKGGDTE